MVDGSLARFLVFQTDDDVPDRNRRPKPVGDVPAELIEALQAIVAGVPGHGRGNIAALVEGPMIVPDPYPVPMAPEAEQLFDALDEELTARQREAIGTNRSAVLARVWENTAKVALIKAVSANPQAPVIRLEDAEWARLVVDRCVTTMITEAERHIAENQTQANHQKVLRLIQGAGDARADPERDHAPDAVPRAQPARGHPQRAGRGRPGRAGDPSRPSAALRRSIGRCDR